MKLRRGWGFISLSDGEILDHWADSEPETAESPSTPSSSEDPCRNGARKKVPFPNCRVVGTIQRLLCPFYVPGSVRKPYPSHGIRCGRRQGVSGSSAPHDFPDPALRHVQVAPHVRGDPELARHEHAFMRDLTNVLARSSRSPRLGKVPKSKFFDIYGVNERRSTDMYRVVGLVATSAG